MGDFLGDLGEWVVGEVELEGSGEFEELVAEGVEFEGFFFDGSDELEEEVGVLSDHLGGGADSGEGVSDFVGDGGGHLSDFG